jgi:putative membrane protein
MKFEVDDPVALLAELRASVGLPSRRERVGLASGAMAPGPDPRTTDHLANERTFLAWFRTGLTLIALGIAAGQFLTLDVAPGVPLVRLLSTVLIGTGGGLVGIGTYRYRQNRRGIDLRSFEPAGVSVVLATGAALVTALLAIVFVWVIPSR